MKTGFSKTTHPTLSLCMIAKDEADQISACLGSVQGLVDEIILVDTGSRDRTPDIAEALGASVYPYRWCDDFSAARNESLRHAKSRWILVLDADEVLNPADHDRIRSLLTTRSVDAFRLIQRSYQEQSTLAEWTALKAATPFSRGLPGFAPSPLVRLFRNTGTVFFKGRVHELVEHDLIAQCRMIQDTDIPIHHYGKALGKDRLLRKQHLYRCIGEKLLEENPEDHRVLRDLGIQYLELGLDAPAEQVLTSARNLLSRDPKTLFNLGVALANQKQFDRAEAVYREVLAVEPNHIGACNNLAKILETRPETGEAVQSLYRAALDQNPDHHVLQFNYGRFLETRGKLEQAAERYRAALRVDPSFQPACRRLQGLEKKQRKPQWAETDAGSPGIQDGGRVASKALAGHLSGGWIEVLESILPMLRANPKDVDLRYRCGYALEMLGETEAALEQYQEAMALNPTHPDTLYRLAIEAGRQGAYSDRQTLLQELLAVAPDHAGARQMMEGGDSVQASQDIPVEGSGCFRALNLAFIWGGKPFSGDTLAHKPLGGTETALIRMTEALAARGHCVRVFVDGGLGDFSGVRYIDINTYEQDLEKSPADILIAARTFHPFIRHPAARARMFWTEDAHDQPFLAPLSKPGVRRGIDRVITVSRWQTDMLSRTFGIPKDRFFVTRNGVFWPDYRTVPQNRHANRLIYTSTPFRGLDVLLDLFPKIRKQVPEAELFIYSSMAVYGVGRKEDRDRFGDLYRKADQPGVRLMGSVRQKDLARALMTAGIFAYPNHFAETSCIAAMEAMAAGLPVVTSRLGALPETVGESGILIEGDSQSERYQKRFIHEICTLMADSHRWMVLSKSGREKIREQNRWETIAGEWESYLCHTLGANAEPAARCSRIIE